MFLKQQICLNEFKVSLVCKLCSSPQKSGEKTAAFIGWLGLLQKMCRVEVETWMSEPRDSANVCSRVVSFVVVSDISVFFLKILLFV